MEKKFEDEFMELQSDLVSLCLELVEQKVNKIYIYCSLEKRVKCSMLFLKLMEK